MSGYPGVLPGHWNQGVLWRMGRSMITGEVHLPRPALLYLFVTLLLHCQQFSNSLWGALICYLYLLKISLMIFSATDF
jgi:hypothetical protein